MGLIGAGVAQLTVLRGADTITSTIEPVDEELPYIVIDAEVLREHPGQQTLTISGSDEEIFAAYGRTSDMQAWLSDTSYNHATLLDESEVEEDASRVDLAVEEATGEFAETGERVWWNPRASDLWVEEMTAEGELETSLTLPDGMSILLSTTGSRPAPADVTVSWDTEVTTPWAGPLIAAGCVALLVGLILWVAGFLHLRRRRGPRRKGPKLPPTAPVDVSEQKQLDAAPTAESDDRHDDGGEQDTKGAKRTRRRALFVVPAFVVSGALLAGCSPSAWPEFGATPTPTPTVETTEPAEKQTPAITDAQADRIIASMSQTMKDADENNDVELAEKRMEGAALGMREVAYDIRSDVEDYPAPPAVPKGPVSVLLPQANDGWPRTALVVVGDEASEDTPTILTMTQSSPWETYKVSYMASISAGVELPELAPAWLGAALVPPDSSFLQVAPEDLASTYADIIGKGEDSEYAELFDLESDAFREALSEKRRTTRDAFNETAEGTAEITFDESAGDSDPVSLATFDSGAIVAVSLDDSETLKPTNTDGVIKVPEAPQVQHFIGEEETATGLTTNYQSELFFFVPAKASEEPIELLGYSYALVGSELLPESEGE
ncbi:glycosyl transferase [Microbacterium sp. G2-8]|uniref:glycosyl transferase n=1 Tax=Microbacterium sp. G2-8 TaxID=2842454 RepID=UPI001C89538C|nr:glycosyl transferase [Microbacterium sp. G2-8]